MRGPVNRRELLGMVLGREPRRDSGDGQGDRVRGPARRPERGGAAMDVAAIAGDFTPEMLAMEAERLGLDPSQDRQVLLAAVMAAMAPAKTRDEEENGPMRP